LDTVLPRSGYKNPTNIQMMDLTLSSVVTEKGENPLWCVL